MLHQRCHPSPVGGLSRAGNLESRTWQHCQHPVGSCCPGKAEISRLGTAAELDTPVWRCPSQWDGVNRLLGLFRQRVKAAVGKIRHALIPAHTSHTALTPQDGCGCAELVQESSNEGRWQNPASDPDHSCRKTGPTMVVKAWTWSPWRSLPALII